MSSIHADEAHSAHGSEKAHSSLISGISIGSDFDDISEAEKTRPAEPTASTFDATRPSIADSAVSGATQAGAPASSQVAPPDDSSFGGLSDVVASGRPPADDDDSFPSVAPARPPPTTNIADDSSVAALMQELEDWSDTGPRSKKKKDPPPAKPPPSAAPKPAPLKGRDPDFNLAGVELVSSSARRASHEDSTGNSVLSLT
jgi:hypothetical protein